MSVLALADTPLRPFGLPIDCELGRTCEIQNYVDRDPGPGAKDYRCSSQTYEAHSGTDFRLLDMRAQKAGVAVLAAADGKVLRTRDGVPDVSVRQTAVVQGQECGNGLVIEHAGGLSTQYCHMAKGSLVVKPGMTVKAGARLGLVGLSGNTEYPHLHFTVRRGSTVIDPFAPETAVGQDPCRGGQDLWVLTPGYKSASVLNIGFSAEPVSLTSVEDGVDLPTGASSALIAYVRAIGLRAADQQSLTLQAPSGAILAETHTQPLTKHQAQRLLYVGKPRPAAGWSKGRYEAIYRLKRNGSTILERRWTITL